MWVTLGGRAPVSQVLRGLHVAPTSAGRREDAGPRGRLLSSRGGPRPGEGDTGAIPLVQQWTMATPVNTLCSFPFNLQDAIDMACVSPSREPCPTARSHRPLSACVCLWSCSKVRQGTGHGRAQGLRCPEMGGGHAWLGRRLPVCLSAHCPGRSSWGKPVTQKWAWGSHH